MAFFKRSTLSVLTIAALAGAGSAQAYSNVVVFGDSLSDGGIYGSRFTTNPGLTAAEYFAQDMGHTLNTSTTGGTNYAQGGARVATNSLTTPAGFAQRPISTQVTEYLTANNGVADPNAIYVIQGGANDVFQNMAAVQAGAMTAAQFQSSLIAAGSAFADQVVRLSSSGARYIVVPNLPNLGATPAFAGAASATGSAASQGYNQVVQTALSTYGINVIALDSYNLLNEIVANPSAYGFTNATGVACTSASSITCSPATLVAPNAASTYVFADGVHPTTAAHKLNAQYMTSVVNAPTQISLLSAAPLAGSNTRLSRLAANTTQTANTPWHVFADADMGRIKFDDAKSTSNNLLVGVDHAVGKGRVGASFGYQRYKGSFGKDAGEFTMTEPSFGVHYNLPLGQNGDSGHVVASASYGKLSTSDIERKIQLGAATRVESGDTSGSHWSLGVKADINVGTWAKGKIKHGPSLSVRYEDIKVKGYSEAGNRSTAMAFEQQSRRGFLASLGYQASGQVGILTPYAKISYELDGTRDSDVRARVKNMYNSFTTPALETRDGGRIEVGTGIAAGQNVKINLGATSTFGKKSGKEAAFNIGVEAKF
ncbi:MAG: SGNH/GDSL hydrolase family protein [Formosimonas sp.]